MENLFTLLVVGGNFCYLTSLALKEGKGERRKLINLAIVLVKFPFLNNISLMILSSG